MSTFTFTPNTRAEDLDRFITDSELDLIVEYEFVENSIGEELCDIYHVREQIVLAALRFGQSISSEELTTLALKYE